MILNVFKKKNSVISGIFSIFSGKNSLSAEDANLIESMLIDCDLGPKLAKEFSIQASKCHSAEEAEKTIKELVVKLLKPGESVINFQDEEPITIMMCGVNGNGKTTTAGKIAKYLTDSGLSVMLAACDTYRAAASDQLRVWADRANCSFHTGDIAGSDPASIAYVASTKANKENIKVLVIDTAGRLHSNTNLMAQLNKIQRSIFKATPDRRIISLLVLDASSGSNVLSQYEMFSSELKIDGVIFSKIDGTERCGVILRLFSEHEITAFFCGFGEREGDLMNFNAEHIANIMISKK